MPNLLGNPNTINVAPWAVSGTGASATSATTMNCGSAAASLMQTVAVAASTTYTVNITLSTVSGANGTLGVNIFTPAYAYINGSPTVTLTGTNQLVSFTFASGANTSLIFELDFDTNNAGAVVSVTNAFLGIPGGNPSRMMLLGVGS